MTEVQASAGRGRARRGQDAVTRRDGIRSVHPTFVPGHGHDRFGHATEWIARSMGTPWFILGLTIFVTAWMAWNTFGPPELRFDHIDLGFIALTLVLSLQASYAAPLILLAQNRQDDRDRVQIAQDRQRAERNLADTEFLAREVVALRLAIENAPSRDFIKAELRAMFDELEGGPAGLRSGTPANGHPGDNDGAPAGSAES